MTAALDVTGVGVRRRRTWTLRDCSLSVPAGRVAALVGPNGAGKTTLLHAVVGLLAPDRGQVRVAGDVAFVAQDKPLYDGFTVAEMPTFGRRLNPRWDQQAATGRLAALGIPLDRRAGRLSGGQQAQVALVLALARRPALLVLDEPLANLDPLARHEVMRTVMAEVAEGEMTVIVSSHVVAELNGVCDWLVVLNGGRLQVSGDSPRRAAHGQSSRNAEVYQRCLFAKGYRFVVYHHPPARFWRFQWTEAGVLAVLSLGLGTGAVRRTLRRKA